MLEREGLRSRRSISVPHTFPRNVTKSRASTRTSAYANARKCSSATVVSSRDESQVEDGRSFAVRCLPAKRPPRTRPRLRPVTGHAPQPTRREFVARSGVTSATARTPPSPRWGRKTHNCSLSDSERTLYSPRLTSCWTDSRLEPREPAGQRPLPRQRLLGLPERHGRHDSRTSRVPVRQRELDPTPLLLSGVDGRAASTAGDHRGKLHGRARGGGVRSRCAVRLVRDSGLHQRSQERRVAVSPTLVTHSFAP